MISLKALLRQGWISSGRTERNLPANTAAQGILDSVAHSLPSGVGRLRRVPLPLRNADYASLLLHAALGWRPPGAPLPFPDSFPKCHYLNVPLIQSQGWEFCSRWSHACGGCKFLHSCFLSRKGTRGVRAFHTPGDACPRITSSLRGARRDPLPSPWRAPTLLNKKRTNWQERKGRFNKLTRSPQAGAVPAECRGPALWRCLVFNGAPGRPSAIADRAMGAGPSDQSCNFTTQRCVRGGCLHGLCHPQRLPGQGRESPHWPVGPPWSGISRACRRRPGRPL